MEPTILSKISSQVNTEIEKWLLVYEVNLEVNQKLGLVTFATDLVTYGMQLGRENVMQEINQALQKQEPSENDAKIDSAWI